MKRTLTDVVVERERLLARCANQRAALAVAVSGLAGPASLLDRVAAGGRFLARHPFAVAATVALAVALRGRSVVQFGLRAIGLWRLAARARSLLHHLQR